MKVIYEYDPYNKENNDEFELKLVQKASEMYTSLIEIEEYLRQCKKGWISPSATEITEHINSIIYETGIMEI